MKRKITMKKYEDEGIKLFLEEYNCAQSVFAALADKIGFNKEDALAIAAPLAVVLQDQKMQY